MTDSDELGGRLAEAEGLRINGQQKADFRRASQLYRDYLNGGGNQRSFAYQMMGVCYQCLGEHDTAIEYFRQALKGTSDYDRGNIERDLGESYGALGRYELAEQHLAGSLQHLPADAYPDAHATTLGFVSRLRRRQGRSEEALKTAAQADRLLSRSGNRHTELYHKLHYASMLSEYGHGLAARRVAWAGLRLARRHDPDTSRRYGSRRHQERALALLLGGHRLEELRRAA